MTKETRIQGLRQAEKLGIGGISLLAPGYTGTAVQVEAGSGGARGGVGDSLPLTEAALAADAVVVSRLRLALKPPAVAVAAEGARSGPLAPPRLAVAAQAGRDYAVLHTDEAGRSTWLFPAAGSTARQANFDLPPAAPTGAKGDDSRGLVTSVMRSLVRVVAWATEPLIGVAAQAIAAHWEGDKRPNGLWQVGAAGSLAAPRWQDWQAGPTLLLIHGTFSTPQVGFAGWVDSSAFDAVAARYAGRVLALAHPSLSASPQDNIDWLLQQLPAAAALGGPIDVVCHSRGGLVARELAARAAIGQAPCVARVCQVGAPNLGTPLADAERWNVFLDAHTNCLTKLPDSVTTVVLEGLLCLVKIIGTGVARGLPGLAAMNPEGDAVRKLAARSVGDTRWFTVGANYEPAANTALGFVKRVGAKVSDAAVDAFFAAENDMVVPTEGCHLPGPKAVESLRITGALTNHANYFQSTEVHAKLRQWLA